MKTVTIKNTKDQIFEAYKEAMEKLKNSKLATYDPVEEKKAKETKEKLNNAKAIVDLGILNEDIIAKYNDLLKAIKIKEAELKEYYDIEKEVDSIAALIEAKKTIEAQMNSNYAAKETEWMNTIADLKERYENDKQQLKAIYESEKASIAKLRARDKEEYDYALERSKKQENDAWEDEKAAREKVLADKEAAVKEREQAMAAREKDIEELIEKVKSIPELISEAETTARKAAFEEAERKHAIEKNVIKRETSLDKTLLEKELESAKQTIERLVNENNSLSNKLEIAQERVQTIATDAVKAAQPVIMKSDKQ